MPGKTEKLVEVVGRRKRRKWRKMDMAIEVNAIEKKPRRILPGKITVDSGAGESVWPVEMIGVGKVEGEKPDMKVGFVAANGTKMQNYGRTKVGFVTLGEDDEGKSRSLRFHVTDVKKPLAAVSRIVDKGNRVSFGPKEEDNFIMNIERGERIVMTRERGTYVLQVGFMIEDDADGDLGFPRQE